MRATLALLLLAAAVCAAQAANTAGTSGRRLLQIPNTCPIANCKDANSCVYDSAKRSWTCRTCSAPFVPNAAKTACVCPAGQYPVSSGKCALCKLGFYCPKGTNPLRSTATRCPANMVTVKRGAASINDCLNAPGFKYQKTVSSVRAVACGDNEYSVGLAKQTACNKCPPGFETDPDNAPGEHTSSAVCLAPPGKFMTGESTSPCPKGEFSDSYSNNTACTTCEEALGSPGVTTANTSSTSKAACNWPMQGYILLDDKKKVITEAFSWTLPTPTKLVSGAKLCPQSWYCQGGDPNTGGTGIPVACFAAGTEADLARLWTENEGAFSSVQCVAPPGHYMAGTTVTKCPADSYAVGFGKPDACTKCGEGLWLAEENIYINQLDAYGAVRRTHQTRGSPDSCYIQKGMGVIRNGTSVTLRAFECPANTYGVVDKKYGLVATPCTPCPTNLVTANADGTDAGLRAQTYMAVSGTSTNTAAGQSFFNVSACLTQAGYGYYNGASQQCPKGWYNAANNRDPCKQCPPGTTTTGTGASQDTATDCTAYLAGYGYVNNATDLCPLGTWQNEGVALVPATGATDIQMAAGACNTCPTNHWTPAPGGVDSVVTPTAPFSFAGDIVCSLCKPGYYSSNSGTTCQLCSDGFYCPASRTGSDVSRTNCPTGRTYTYTWETTEVYEPPAISIYGASSPDACLALFAQTTDQSSFLNLDLSSNTLTPVADALSLSACLEACQNTTYSATCMAATFSYNGTEPECRVLLHEGAALPAGGFAFKTMPSTNLAQSKTVSKGMGTGYYTYWKGKDNAALVPTLGPVIASKTLQGCEDECTYDPLCAGIRYAGFVDMATNLGSCRKVMSSAAINTNRRTLIRAKVDQIGMLLVPGTYFVTASSTVAPCPAGNECPGGTAGFGAADPGKTPCTAGFFSAAGASSCAPCGTGTTSAAGASSCGLTAPGYYHTGTAVALCPAGYTCAGGATITTSAIGSALCTTNTFSYAGHTGPCNACTSGTCDGDGCTCNVGEICSKACTAS